MKKLSTHNQWSSMKSETDIQRLQQMTEDEINAAALSDEDSLPIEHWPENVTVYHPAKKTLISLRIDNDILSYFKSFGSGHLSRINSVLRSYMHHQQKIRHEQ